MFLTEMHPGSRSRFLTLPNLRPVQRALFPGRWWRPVELPLRSSCSVPGFLWASAGASYSPRAGLGKLRTTSCWQTCTVCGRRGWTQLPSRRERRYTQRKTNKNRWCLFCSDEWNRCFLPPRSWTDVCEPPSKLSSHTCARWLSRVCREVTGGPTARPRFPWRDRRTAATSAWSWRVSWQGCPSTGSLTAPPPPSLWYEPHFTFELFH